jgi:nitroreductase
MDVLMAIAARRSIRAFKPIPVPDEALQTILTAATQAPSGKNRQPWRFVVVREDHRAEMVRILRAGIEEAKAHGIDHGSSENTAAIMEQAPLTVFVFNPEGIGLEESRSVHQVLWDAVNVQSVGAAIQNMLLAALALGLGSLWICDVYYAYEGLQRWLDEPGQLVAAVSFGYPDENPDARPRLPVAQVSRTR